MKVLGLDCSGRRVGWAVVGSDGAVVESGVQEFRSRRGESVGLVYLRYRKWLAGLMDSVDRKDEVFLVAYEVAHMRGGHATEMAIAMQTRAQELAAACGAVPVPAHTATVKAFAAGKGNAGKGEMVKAAEAVLGRPPLDDNEADAVHIARWAASEYGLPSRVERPAVVVLFSESTGEPVCVVVDTDMEAAGLAARDRGLSHALVPLVGSTAALRDDFEMHEDWPEDEGSESDG